MHNSQIQFAAGSVSKQWVMWGQWVCSNSHLQRMGRRCRLCGWWVWWVYCSINGLRHKGTHAAWVKGGWAAEQCCTHRPGPRLRHWVVVCVPLLRLSVDLSVAPTKGSFHLRHGEGAHRRAARRPFVPAGDVKQLHPTTSFTHKMTYQPAWRVAFFTFLKKSGFKWQSMIF